MRGHWARRSGVHRSLCWLSLASIAAGLVPFVGAQEKPPQPEAIMPAGPPVEMEIAAGATSRFTVTVPVQQTVVLTITEVQQRSSVTWTDAAGHTHTPRTNLAGKGAQIRFTLPGSGQPQSIAVAGSNRKSAATVRIVASAAQPEGARDRIAEQGEEALAKANALWATRVPEKATEALADYDRAAAAWEQLNDSPMLRQTLAWKAIDLAFTLGKPEQALPAVLRAVHLPDAGDTVEQANAWKSAGFIQTDLADYSAGWQDYANALRLYAESGDEFNQEVLLENRGKVLQMTGDYEGALDDAKRAKEMAREVNDAIGVLHIEYEIGSVALRQEWMQTAFDAYTQVLDLQQVDPADAMIGFAETDLANLYQQMGAAAQSRDMQTRAEAFWTAHPYLLGQLYTLIQRAKFEEDAGQLANAFATDTRTLQLAESAGMKREKVFILLGLGTICSKQGRIADARSYFAQANQLAGEIHEQDALAEIATAQGDLEMRLENLPAARAHYASAVETAQQLFDHADLIPALGDLARADFRSGDDRAALSDIRQALGAIESVRDSVPLNSLRTGYFSSWHSYYALAVKILMHLDAAHPGQGYDGQALIVAERGRARFLLDQMAQSGSERGNPEDRRLRERQEASLRQIHLAESSLAAMRSAHRPAPETAKLASEIGQLVEKEDRLEAAMSRNQQGMGISGAAELFRSPDALLRRLQRKLGPETAALEYWTNQDESYLWVITAASLHAYRLAGAEKLSLPEEQLRRDLTATPRPEASTPEAFSAALSASSARFNAAARQLGQWLLPPGALPAGTHTLLVVGDGPVLSVPFGALRVANAAGRGVHYLQEQECVIREPSLATLLEVLEREVRHGSRQIAVIADPVFDADDPRLDTKADPSLEKERRGAEDPFWKEATGGGSLERLAYASQEVRAIEAAAGRSNVHPQVGFAASTEQVRSMDWPHYEIVHFATHAFLNPVQPDLSNILLSRFDRNGHSQPGALWFSDIASMHMPVDLVVLSACQTANGDRLPGEGLVGLSYSFLIAGARRVVGSLWDVDDAATAELMRRFYQALYSGSVSPAEALRSAQRGIAHVPRWSNPYYWAGFTMEGDPHSLPAR